MSARLESFVARLYVDETAREAYLADGDAEAARAGLDESERVAVARIDPVDLRLAAGGFARKRAHKKARPSRAGVRCSLFRFLRIR